MVLKDFVSPNRHAALTKLLQKLYPSNEQLLLFLREAVDERDFFVNLPSPNVPQRELTDRVVQQLESCGIIDQRFFIRLERDRPRRSSDIRKVRDLWLCGHALAEGALWCDEKFRMVRHIGGGGGGLVWQATDLETGEQVAIKVLHENYANRKERARFLRGASVLARCNHPAIVRVLRPFGQEGTRYFYVMELLRGDTLAQWVERGGHSQAALLRLLLRVGDALAHVHARGLVHRDVKPSNIIVTKHEVKLIDFDLVTGGNFDALTTRAVAGTERYMPPEAFTRCERIPVCHDGGAATEPCEACTRKRAATYDVYSLARTVEFVLGGREPPQGRRDGVAELDVSERVKAVLRAALDEDPARRTPSIERFCDELRAVFVELAGDPSPARRSARVTAPAHRPAPRPAPTNTATRLPQFRPLAANRGLVPVMMLLSLLAALLYLFGLFYSRFTML